ncbi:hypothetical protein SNEBB_003439 [Seison nebaliae]|nr:hypothetical protein SNEBB_003439 [Seison nebaliae]
MGKVLSKKKRPKRPKPYSIDWTPRTSRASSPEHRRKEIVNVDAVQVSEVEDTFQLMNLFRKNGNNDDIAEQFREIETKKELKALNSNKNKIELSEEIRGLSSLNASIEKQLDLFKSTGKSLDWATIDSELGNDESSEDAGPPYSIKRINYLMNSGKLSPSTLVAYYMTNIRKLDLKENDGFNAVFKLNSTAMSDALEMEKSNNKKKLHGICVLVKDNILTKDGLTAGNVLLEKEMNKLEIRNEATLIRSLKEEDAIILGKVNMSELAGFVDPKAPSGYSSCGGQTKNPYGKFMVAGSSSGSAVSVAANLCSAAIGTETIGSIIAPSAQASCVGYKPSVGLISRHGILQLVSLFDTAGPIGRYVEDVAVLLQSGLVNGRDFNDIETGKCLHLKNFPFYDVLQTREAPDFLRNKTIGVAKHLINVNKESKKLFDSSLEILADSGVKFINIGIDELTHPTIDLVTLLSYGIRDSIEVFSRSVKGRPIKLEDIINETKTNKEKSCPYGCSYLEDAIKYPKLPSPVVQKLFMEARKRARESLQRLFANNYVDYIVSINNCMSDIYAPAGHPACTIPAGYSESGEPIGLTIIGDFGEDDEVVQAAFAFEQMSKCRKSLKFDV